MKSITKIGVLILLLQVYETQQQALWNNWMVYPEGFFPDLYNNPYSPYFNSFDSFNHFVNNNPAPPLVFPESTINGVKKNLSGTTKPDINSIQSILKLFDHQNFFKPLDVTKDSKIGTTNLASDVQYFPEIILPNYNQYNEQYIPGFYNFYPQYGFSNGFVEPTNPYLFFTPESSYINPYSLFNQENPYPYSTAQYNPKKEVSFINDKTYKVTLKSNPNVNQQSHLQSDKNVTRVKGFKTNFSGDITKCDMICKCRDVLVKQPPSS